MKNTLLVAFVLMFTLSANAQLLYQEDFNYASSSALIGQGGWTLTSSTTNPFTVGSTGLTYTGYLGSGVGNGLPIANTGQDVYNNFTNQTSGTVYASILVNFSATNFGGTGNSAYAGDYFFHLTQGLITSNAFFPRVFVRSADNGNITFGISKSSVSSAPYRPTFGDSVYLLNTTYLLVAKYQFNGGAADDEVSLFVFEAPALPATEPVTPYVGPVSTDQADATGLDIVSLRQGSATSAPTGIIDGIRVATSWDFAPLPVELTSFKAIAKGHNVELQWNTATETNNYGFEVEKNVAGSWNKIGFVEGNGTTNAPKAYSFIDASAKGTVSYRLKQIDRDGSFEYSKTVEATVADIKTFGLDQNYPNPFNPATIISYQLPVSGQVTLKVYDMLGKEVATLVNEMKNSGAYSARFDGSQLSTGIYFYTLQAGNFTATKKLMLIK